MKSIKGKVNLSWNKKCSCYQFSLPARRSCPGVEERMKNPMSVCNFCYACNSHWDYPAAKAFLEHNYKWVAGHACYVMMLEEFLESFDQIPEKHKKYFRFFGSGDVMTLELGLMIISLAEMRPETKFWLTTHDAGFWDSILDCCPVNLSVLLSSDNVDDPAMDWGATVVSGEPPAGYYKCPGKCETCRVCWDANPPKVAFQIHGSACTMAKYKRAKNNSEKVIDKIA